MTMPTMPNAHATLGALGSMRPMICQIIFVIGKYFSRIARIKPSLTSSIAKEKVRIVPAIKFAIIERQGDFAQRPEWRRAQVRRRFFESYAGLLKTGVRGANDVRQPPDAVTDDQQQTRIVARVQPLNFEIEPGDVTEREHESGQRQRQHCQRIEQAGERNPSARQQPRNHDAEHEVEQRAEGGITQTVSNAGRRQTMAENFGVVRHGPVSRQNGEEPVL